jgi:hypothetical protein
MPPTRVHEFTTRLSTAVIEALGDPIVEVDLPYQIVLARGAVVEYGVGDACVLTSDDGDVFIADIDQIDPTRPVARLRLR